MTTLSYRNILFDSIKLYTKHFIPFAGLLAIMPITYILANWSIDLTKSDIRIYYFIASVLMLVFIFAYYFAFKATLNIFNYGSVIKNIKFDIVEFAHFIMNIVTQWAIFAIALLPTIVSGILFLVSLYERIRPYDKTNLTFTDLRYAISGINIYFIIFLAVLLINIPIFLYVYMRVGFSHFYLLDQKLSNIESIKKNISDTSEMDWVSCILVLLVVLVLAVCAELCIFLPANTLAGGFDNSKILNVSLALIAIALLPIIYLKLGVIFKKISRKSLIG